jgi:anti-sigma B factor antagonist
VTEAGRLSTVRVGTWAMAVLPSEIDMTCAADVAADLGTLLGESIGVLVADMTATSFCDTAGVQALVGVHHAARAADSELRLVVPAASIRRAFELLEVDRVLLVYQSLDEAMADAPGSYRPSP